MAQVYRWPDIQPLIFFSAFTLTDPPTSPARAAAGVRPAAASGTPRSTTTARDGKAAASARRSRAPDLGD